MLYRIPAQATKLEKVAENGNVVQRNACGKNRIGGV